MRVAYDLLIFDWDGTLSDSSGYIVSRMQEAIRELGLPPRDDRQIAELIGLGIVDGLRRLYPELDLAALLRKLMIYRARSTVTDTVTPLFPGVLETLTALRAVGYRMAVATGQHREGLRRSLLTYAELAAFMEVTRCADEAADKPDPLMLRQILTVTGVTAERALMIGDTEYDMAMARALGMPALGVGCGVHEAHRLRQAGALAVIDGVSVLPGWLAADRNVK